MDENKRKRLVYLIFACAVIYGVINFAGRGKRTAGDVALPTIEPINVASVGGAASDTLAPEGYSWERDPFAYGRASTSGGNTEERVTKFQLAAISESNGKLMAIINGKAVVRGEVIDGWTVSALSKSGATLSQNGRDIALEIGN